MSDLGTTLHRRLKAVAIPILAAFVFSMGTAMTPTVEGGVSVSTVEAKSKHKHGKQAKAKHHKKDKRKAKRSKHRKKHTKSDHRDRHRDREGDRDRHWTYDGERDRDRAWRRDRDRDGERERRWTRDGDRLRDDDRDRRWTRDGDHDWDRDRDRSYDRHRDGDRDHDHASRDRYERQGDAYEDRSWGRTASQLKHRNAANASERAFQNASPNSNVGRLSTYREAARATEDRRRDIRWMNREIEDLEARRDFAEVAGDYDRADALEARIMRLEDRRLVAEEDLYHLTIAEQDAFDAVGGPVLDSYSYDVFRSMLGLN